MRQSRWAQGPVTGPVQLLARTLHSTNPMKTNRYLTRTKYKLFHISGMFLWSQLGVGRTLHQTLTLVMKDNVERKYLSLRNWFKPKLKSSDFLFLVSQLTYLYWSRRLACATRVGERKRSWPLFSPTFFVFFFFILLLLLLFTHFGDTPEAEIFPPPHILA